MLNTSLRQALLEDLFVAAYIRNTSESNLRSMARWFFTCGIFMDETVRDLWNRDTRGHSAKGEQAMRAWLELNNSVARIAGACSTPVVTVETDNADV